MMFFFCLKHQVDRKFVYIDTRTQSHTHTQTKLKSTESRAEERDEKRESVKA